MSRRVGTDTSMNILARRSETSLTATRESVSGGWLPIRHMLLEPGVRLLLDYCGLAPGHAGGQDGREVLIFLVAAGAGEDRPEIGLIHILGHTTSTPIERSQFSLSQKAAAFGGPGKPTESFLFVAANAIFFVSLKIAKAQRILRRRIAVRSHLPKLDKGGGLDSGS